MAIDCQPGQEIEVDEIVQGINTNETSINAHTALTDNPHSVTASQVGAEPADPAIQTHITDTANPHSVTASQVGALTPTGDGSGLTGLTKGQVNLGNVDNTADLDKPISTATQTALNNKITSGNTQTTVPRCTELETLTQAEYDGLTPDAGILYIIVG